MVAVRGPVSALSVIALTLFPTLSHALPSAAFVDSGRGPPKGYTEVEMKWDIVVDRQNHPNVTTTFNGTIESAMRQAQALNPDFFTQVGIDADQFNANEPPVMLSHEKTKTASKTVDFPFPFNIQTAISCFDKMTGWHGASSAGIEQQIKYLRGVPGHPRLSPGPSECVRVSCSWNDAVWWCNDVRSILPLLVLFPLTTWTGNG